MKASVMATKAKKRIGPKLVSPSLTMNLKANRRNLNGRKRILKLNVLLLLLLLLNSQPLLL
jgi:hypothetical protein